MKHFEKHDLHADILVAGGGMSGVACALSAARQGSRVILCQDRSVLGGNASSEIRMHIVGANSNRPTGDGILEPRETGIIEEIRLENSMRNPQRSTSMFDLILYEKCRGEPNLTLLLNTVVTGASVEGRKIREVTAVRTSTEDIFRIRSQVYVDCTGDGGLGVAAGAGYLYGREDREAFGESLAQEIQDRKCLGSTILFMAKKHDSKMPYTAPSWARRFTEEDLKYRNHGQNLEYGYWWIEWGGELDTIKENETIRDELLAIVLGVWDHVKNGGDHGADHWALDWFGFLPGKRESRRFIGQHVLTQNELMESVPFHDAIAYGGWPLDLHPPEGVDASEEKPCTQHPLPYLYDIPLRACVSRDVDNLMFAGRNLSATHVAFASTRVMATCALVGEGVGMAAAFAVETGKEPSSLAMDSGAMHAIQQHLLAQDVYLIHRYPDKNTNLAQQAVISCSSSQRGGDCHQVLSGQDRALSNRGGVQEGRFLPGSHRWMAQPGFPAWIQFDWEETITVREIRLVFDTGLHRHLTLTMSEEYLKFMHWGGGQPETVKHYRIEVRNQGEWQTLIEEKENWSRLKTHTFEETPLQLTSLRIVVESTWGIDHARIFSVVVSE